MIPVAITVYTRIEHLKRCIHALLECPEAQYTTLIVASDGPARDEDAQRVQDVRDYIDSLSGFKSIVKVYHSQNVGPVENAKALRAAVSESFDAFIRMEDDVIVSSVFLTYMNCAVKKFEKDKSIVGICGFTDFPLQSSPPKAFTLTDRAPYGYASWISKEEKLNAYKTNSILSLYLNDAKQYRKLTSRFYIPRQTLIRMLRTGIVLGDFMVGVASAHSNKRSVYLSVPTATTIGMDGSGMHGGVHHRYEGIELLQEFSPAMLDGPIESEDELYVQFRRSTTNLVQDYCFWLGDKISPSFYQAYRKCVGLLKGKK